MEALVVKQLPFAMSRGLNRAVSIARDRYLRPAYDKKFERRNKQFFKGVHTISNSDKRQWRYGYLMAAIQERDSKPPAGSLRGSTEKRDMDTSFMNAHVVGGNRYPRRKAKFVPLSSAPIKRRKGGAKAGSVVKSVSPEVLYPTEGGRTFFADVNGKTVLFRRRGRGKKQKPQAMYHLRKVISNKAKYKPINVVKYAINRHLPLTLNRSIIEAIRTARLK
jgi:hypothetical protein